jgi:hypothetical protein
MHGKRKEEMDENSKRNRREKEKIYFFFCMKFNCEIVPVHALE